MRYIKTGLMIILILGGMLSANVFAASAGDQFVSCDASGTLTGEIFTTAGISLQDNDIDTSGKNIYYGVDVAVVKKPLSGLDWDNICAERVVTSSLDIKIENFGNMSWYDNTSVYAVAYRILYRAGNMSNPIIETSWKQVDNSYFKVAAAGTYASSGFTDRVTAANKWISNLVTQIKKYNNYFMDSEVVSKVVIDPLGDDIDSYAVDLDLNADSNSKIDIHKFRVVKVVYGIDGPTTAPEDKKISEKPPIYPDPYDPSAASDSTVSFKIGAGPNDVGIAGRRPGTDKVTAYFKYSFKKKNKTDTLGTDEKQILNKATITSDNGVDTGTKEKTNTIYILDVKGIYM